MGALRAAETDRFGTVGVGAVYRAYRSGTIEDDDEVAVVHGPEDTGYRPLSEAMVNIRATLRAAVRARVLSGRGAAALEARAKALYYPERTWAALLGAAPDLGLSAAGVARLRRWLPRGRVDQKAADALRMLRRMRTALAADPPPFRARFDFEHTVFWEAVARRVHLARSDPT
jgi:hypothetical protein